MSRRLAATAAIVCAVAVLIALSARASRPSAAETAKEPAQQGSDIVMLRCATTGDFSVLAYKGSTQAPAKRAASCPEQIALLAKDGFATVDVGYSNDAEIVVYTLER